MNDGLHFFISDENITEAVAEALTVSIRNKCSLYQGRMTSYIRYSQVLEITLFFAIFVILLRYILLCYILNML